MRALANILVLIGILGLAYAVVGRFVGDTTIQGFQAVNVLIAANSVILLAIFCRLSEK